MKIGNECELKSCLNFNQFRKAINLFAKLIVFASLLATSITAYSQSQDSIKVPGFFSGAISVTNDGISLIPTFTLGKPAVTFDMALGKRKLSFEPEFQFSLDGKPWGYFFWWRYKLVSNSRFFVRIGAHYALAFQSEPVTINAITNETIIAQRYVAGEFCPNYFLTKNISMGMYYLYSYGIDNEFVRNTHFLMLNMNFANIKLSDKISLSYMPQVYFLKINNNTGYNFTSTLTITHKSIPLALSAFANKTIQSHIPGSKDLVWNVSMIYTFGSKYLKQ